MLNFVTETDSVFKEILDMACNFGIYYNFRATYNISFPNASKVFPFRLAKKTIKNLKSYNQSRDVYDLNDYHYDLIYDLLWSFYKCIIGGKEKNSVRIGTKYVKISFYDLISIYFPDIDFLTPKEQISNPKLINRFDFRLDALGVILGLKATPAILENKLLKEHEYAFIRRNNHNSNLKIDSGLYPECIVFRDEKIGKFIPKSPPPKKSKEFVKKALVPNWNKSELPEWVERQKGGK